MPQTRMFRDRVVSMEQTFEGGEKHLELLKSLCREALPEFDYAGHLLDHERDLFVMELAAADGRRKTIGWTRMVLFDAERIPVLSGDPAALLRSQIVEFLRSRASRSEILVTFRHLEEGWVDTPEPRRERRRRRRGRGEGRDAGERGAGRPRGGPPARERAPDSPRGAAQAAQGGRSPQDRERRAAQRGERRAAPESPRGGAPGRERGPRPDRSVAPPASVAGQGAPRLPEGGAEAGRREGDRGRRRFRRRRRRGRGSGGGGAPPPAAPA